MCPLQYCYKSIGVAHPTENHIAKTAPLGEGLGSAKEFVAVQILAAQDAVDAADSHLELATVGHKSAGNASVRADAFALGGALRVVCLAMLELPKKLEPQKRAGSQP
jgi:hypothetical protein